MTRQTLKEIIDHKLNDRELLSIIKEAKNFSPFALSQSYNSNTIRYRIFQALEQDIVNE